MNLHKVYRPFLRYFRAVDTKTFFRHPLYANASFIWAARAARSGLTFVFWLIAARFYPKEAVGLAATLTSMMLLVGELSTLGLIQGLVRFLPESDRPRDMVNTTFALIALMCSLVATLFLVGIPWWSPALSGLLSDWLLRVLFIGLAVGGILFETLLWVFIALRAAHNTSVTALVGAGLRVVLVLIMSAFVLGPTSLVAVYFGALFLAFLVGAKTLLPRCMPDYRFAWRGVSLRHVLPSLRFSLGNYVNNLLWMAPAYLLPLVVLNILGEEAAADFYIAWLLANVITMAADSLATSLFAEGSNASHRLSENARQSFWGGLLVTGLLVAGLLLLARPMLSIFGEEYSTDAVQLMRILCLAVFLGVIPTTFMAIAQVKKWMGRLVGVSAVRAVVGLVGAAWLATIYGLTGVGIAWAGAQVVSAGIIALLMLNTSASHRQVQV